MKILFVDDEKLFMQPYVDAFKAEPDAMEVIEINIAIKAVEKIIANVEINEFDCLVLDIMMPPPPGWEAITENGQFTGIEVLKKCQANISAIELPVLVLSNLSFKDVNPKIASLKLTQGMFKVHSKNLTPPRDAKKIVRDLAALRVSRLNNPNR